MNDGIEINDGIVYVKGCSRGAIYSLNDGNVYSVNSEACKMIEDFISGECAGGDFIEQLKKANLIRHGFRARPYSCCRLTKRLDFAWLELTETCNLRCIHCYEGDAHKDTQRLRLTFTQWKNVIKQLRDIGCRRIEFIGGEPTVYPQFEELLEYAAALGHGVEIFSNLQAFNDQIIGVAKDNDIMVHFSIYGSSAAIHDSVTRKTGSFEILMNRLDRLLESNVRVVPAITIMRQNQEDIDCIITLLGAKGIPKERISMDAVRSTTCRATTGLEITDSQKNLALRSKPNFRADKNFFQKARCANTCLFGKLSIHSDGLVSPCEFARDIVYGNVKDQTIEQIMDSETLTKFWYFDFTKIEPCNGCEYRFACKDCRMLRDKSEICMKNPRCLYDPVSGVWPEFEKCGVR